MRRRRVLEPTLAFLFWAVPAAPLDGQAALTGTVREDSTHRPLGGVEVIVLGTGRQTVTDAAGRYTLGDLAAGSHVVLFRSIGYHPSWHRVSLSGNRTGTVDATLIPSVVELEPLEVTGRLKAPRGIGLEAFEERRRKGFGRFIDSTELRRSEHLRLADVLRRQYGIDIGRAANQEAIALSRRIRCPMQVWLDGVPLYLGGTDGREPPDLATLDVFGLVAVEIYRSTAETPLEYGGPGVRCGTLLLWTRRGLDG